MVCVSEMPRGRFLGVDRLFVRADIAVYMFPHTGDEFENETLIRNVEPNLSRALDVREVRLVSKNTVEDNVGVRKDSIVLRYPGQMFLTPTSVDEDMAFVENSIEEAIDPEWGFVPV